MGRPTTDRGAIQQVIRALIAGGWALHEVDNGEEEVRVTSETKALEEITAVDESHLFVYRDDPTAGMQSAWLFFVLGNDPEEVVNDHTTNLSPVLDPLMGRWEA